MNYTVKRLLELNPGETMIYYKGHFPTDIGCSDEKAREILEQVRRTALDLAAIGEIELKERLTGERIRVGGITQRVIEYIAHRPPIR